LSIGQGTFLFEDGTIYRGLFQRNLKHGPGILYYTDNTRFTGNWENDLVAGGGEITTTRIIIPSINNASTNTTRSGKKIKGKGVGEEGGKNNSNNNNNNNKELKIKVLGY
jgi:hypothetical protein